MKVLGAATTLAPHFRRQGIMGYTFKSQVFKKTFI